QQQVVCRHRAPVGLVQVLARVRRLWMVCGVRVHGGLPVVRGPHDVAPGLLGALAESAQPGEQVDGAGHGLRSDSASDSSPCETSSMSSIACRISGHSGPSISMPRAWICPPGWRTVTNGPDASSFTSTIVAISEKIGSLRGLTMTRAGIAW